MCRLPMPGGPSEPNLVRSGEDGEVVCDLREIADIFGGVGPEVVTLVNQFLANTQEAAAALETALARDDFGEARHAAHRIAGGAHSIGAVELGRLCSFIETRLVADDPAGARAATATVSMAIARMIDFAQTIRST